VAESPSQLLALQEYLALQELLALQEKKQAASPTAAKYLDDPLGFIDNCVTFPVPRRQGKRAVGLAPYQREVISSLPEKKRVAVRGPRGLGKTALASLVILWFALTRDMAGIDWKIMTTAGSWGQLEGFLWPEVKRWAYCVNWDAVGRPPLSERNELMKHGLSLRYGLALAGSPDQPERIEGLHGDAILYVYDEAKLIIPETFDAAEGAFSGADEESGLEAYALAISTPGPPAGRFYDIHRQAPGLEDWHPRHVTLDEAVAAGRMSMKWVAQREKLWGRNSALFMNHVLGEFCSDDEDAIIPLAWAEAAVDRWRDWDRAGRPHREGQSIVGVDVARSGKDRSAAAIRMADVITEIRTWAKADTMETTGIVKGILGAHPGARAMVDVIGLGAGVYDRLREQGCLVDPFNAGKKTTRRDATSQFGFANVRSAAWYSLREQLDPSRGSTLALPPYDELLGDLTAVHYKMMSDAKIMVEPKDDIRARIGRSTDMGDTVMQAMWLQAGSWLDAYGVTMCPDEVKCGRGFAAEVNGEPRTRCPYCDASLEEELAPA